MAVLTPGGTTGWNLQSWKNGFEMTTYQRYVVIPILEDYGKRLYGTGNVRKHARVSGTVLGQSDDGSTLTASTIIGTPITITAAGNYVMAAWSENEDAQIDANLDAEGAANIEQALAELTETSVQANAQSLTQILSQAAVDAPMFRQAFGRMVGNTNGVTMPGGDKTVYAVFSHTQYPNIMNIPEFTEAQVRGDSENPQVKGIWGKGNGVQLMLSTVVAQDANGWHNFMFTSDAFVVGWNARSRIKRQDYNLQNKVIAFNNMGSAVQHDLRAIAMRTTANAL